MTSCEYWRFILRNFVGVDDIGIIVAGNDEVELFDPGDSSSFISCAMAASVSSSKLCFCNCCLDDARVRTVCRMCCFRAELRERDADGVLVGGVDGSVTIPE